MALPLLTRGTERRRDVRADEGRLRPRRGAASRQVRCRSRPHAERALEPGEQYRFHFDMGKCIGASAASVACNEQNGNPATINWRRVGDIEGGFFPAVAQHHLSMGCNHCSSPPAWRAAGRRYSKDRITGIVRPQRGRLHRLQYCTWKCSYGVPQFKPERGVVGKCDMCHGRLEEGQAPACVARAPRARFRSRS
jgi:Fe-S-cluster-containing dehydrogenase component